LNNCVGIAGIECKIRQVEIRQKREKRTGVLDGEDLIIVFL
jgi:hypothetical protein